MPLNTYSLLRGRVEKYISGRTGQTPHFEHLIKSDKGVYFRIAVNVKSESFPSELKSMVIPDFKHYVTDKLIEYPSGLTKVSSHPGGAALDFIRGNLFKIDSMKPIPTNLPGENNDLNDLLELYTNQVMQQKGEIFALGASWGPEQAKDQYFNFSPGQGIHDIHMNQGNVGQWVNDDGVWQDGGLFFYFPKSKSFVSVFLAFQSQAIHTDDVTGHAVKEDIIPDQISALRIVAALINPSGVDTGKEAVTVMNVSPKEINLSGWKLSDKNKNVEPIPATILSAGQSLLVKLSGKGLQLPNNGGQITLLTPNGLKADGVSYTKKDASNEGWVTVF